LSAAKFDDQFRCLGFALERLRQTIERSHNPATDSREQTGATDVG